MSQYGAYTLKTMQGIVAQHKPNAPPLQIREHINARIRKIIDSRPVWSSLIGRTVVAVPNSYQQGNVNLNLNSTTVTGSGTAWPYFDAVNTDIPNGVNSLGWTEVQPSSMDGIQAGLWLYIDGAAGPTQAEAVPVIDANSSTFIAEFKKPHNRGCSVWRSSLSGMQLKMGTSFPIYTARAFHSDNEMELDIPWGGTALTNSGYQLVGMYYSIAPDFKDFITTWDPLQGMALSFHKPESLLNILDPQRQSTGDPQFFADLSPDPSGVMFFELWPTQTTARQIGVLYIKQWPRLIRPTDRPPYFINPDVIVKGAIADALRIKNVRPGSGEPDEFFNPILARDFEAQFNAALAEAIYADQGKALECLSASWDQLVSPGGAAFFQDHLYPSDWQGMY